MNCKKVWAGGTFVYLCRTTYKQMQYFTLSQRTALAYDYQQWATQFYGVQHAPALQVPSVQDALDTFNITQQYA
jgi:hypothetical protein